MQSRIKLRKTRRFSQDMQATHAILLNSQNPKTQKINAYRAWFIKNQPCVFGRLAATQKRVFICLLEENEILGMRKGDKDLRDTIQDYRQLWEAVRPRGITPVVVIAVIGESLVTETPGERLKEVLPSAPEAVHGNPHIPDDTIVTQREYVFLRMASTGAGDKFLKIRTLPNYSVLKGTDAGGMITAVRAA